MAESTTAAPKGAASNAGNGTAPATPTKQAATTTYLAFVWQEPGGDPDGDGPVYDGGWVPLMDGKTQREFVVPSGQVERVQQEACVLLAKEQPLAKSFRIAVVSARFWTEESFEQEPPPPPSFKRAGA